MGMFVGILAPWDKIPRHRLSPSSEAAGSYPTGCLQTLLKTPVAGARFRCEGALLSEGRSVMAVEEEIGRVRDYFARIDVAGIDLTGKLKAGDTIPIHGHTNDITQGVDSMQ